MKELIENYIHDRGLPCSVIVKSKQDILLIKDIPALNNSQIIIKPLYPQDTVTLLYGRDKIIFKPEKNEIHSSAKKANRKNA